MNIKTQILIQLFILFCFGIITYYIALSETVNAYAVGLYTIVGIILVIAIITPYIFDTD